MWKWRESLLTHPDSCPTNGDHLNVFDLADKANHLFDFAKNVAALWQLIREGTGLPLNRRRKNAKTALALAELAVSAKGEVSLDYKTADGDQLILHIRPKQGEHLLE